MTQERITTIIAIALVIISVCVGCARSVQVFNLRSTVHMLESTRSLQSVALHDRLEAMQAKDAYAAEMYAECTRVIQEVYDNLLRCDHFYRQCIAEKTADAGAGQSRIGG